MRSRCSGVGAGSTELNFSSRHFCQCSRAPVDAIVSHWKQPQQQHNLRRRHCRPPHVQQQRHLTTNTSMEVFTKDDTSLLTLSRHDLSNAKNDKDDEDTLVLMQMPSSLNASDLKEAHIVASSSQQVCLVVEDKACTYAMSRVETSNAYIMVPPPLPSFEERPRKKAKTNLVSVPVRLLQPGGSGAFFLELKTKTLMLADLQNELRDHVFDPFNADKQWTGRTLASLAVDLQASQQEVVHGLQRMQALGIMGSDGTMSYGLLSEEALQEAKASIVATLTECDDFQDYAGTGIWEDDCLQQVMNRTSETYTHLKDVIQHTLGTLQSNAKAADGDKIQLDVEKVRLV